MNQNGNVVNFGYRNANGIEHFEDTELLQASTIEYMSNVAVNGEYGQRFIAYLQSLSYDELRSYLKQTRQLYGICANESFIEVLKLTDLKDKIFIDINGEFKKLDNLTMNFFYELFGIKTQTKLAHEETRVTGKKTKILVRPFELAMAMIKFIELSIEQALVKYNGIPSNVIDIRAKLNQKTLEVLNNEPIQA